MAPDDCLGSFIGIGSACQLESRHDKGVLGKTLRLLQKFRLVFNEVVIRRLSNQASTLQVCHTTTNVFARHARHGRDIALSYLVEDNDFSGLRLATEMFG